MYGDSHIGVIFEKIWAIEKFYIPLILKSTVAMIHYRLPEGFAVQPLPFYLAMEEWVARRHCSVGERRDAFFTWQVEPTVIFGRNQQIDKEVNINYCRDHGISTYRRKSGGGCVFADMSNMMLSYITDSQKPVPEIFRHFAGRIAAEMRGMGIEAEVSGRNDLLIDGRKVSGCAFYHTPEGMSIVHGTMLYDTDMSHMANAITPSRAKLESKGVKSVKSRITMLREHTSMSLAEFRRRLIDALCSDEYMLSDADIRQVREIERPYHRPEWIEGRTRRATGSCSMRIDGVGEVELSLRLDADGRIADANLTGDFFPTADIDTLLLRPMIGARPGEIARLIAAPDATRAVPGLTPTHLQELAHAAVH